MVSTLTRIPQMHRDADSDRLAKATQPLARLLRQLANVVQHLTDSQYTQKPVGVVESSVGGHVRHCLNHVRSLLSAIELGHLDYDFRRRGTPVETSRCCALAEIDELVSELRALPANLIDRPLSMSVLMTSGEEPIEVRTTVGRELAYTLTHTIHHNALVAAMVKTLGGWLPERFGYAPSTEKHLNEIPCAR
jgi:uncharacterized damage-inducible protein DinB